MSYYSGAGDTFTPFGFEEQVTELPPVYNIIIARPPLTGSTEPPQDYRDREMSSQQTPTFDASCSNAGGPRAEQEHSDSEMGHMDDASGDLVASGPLSEQVTAFARMLSEHPHLYDGSAGVRREIKQALLKLACAVKDPSMASDPAEPAPAFAADTGNQKTGTGGSSMSDSSTESGRGGAATRGGIPKKGGDEDGEREGLEE